MNWPASFIVGANIGAARGGGHLWIQPGAIILELGPLLRRVTSVQRIVHTAPTVTIVGTRRAPPWINTHLILQDDEHSGIASTWWGARPRLRAALHAAGFSLHQIETWFSFGKAELRK